MKATVTYQDKDFPKLMKSNIANLIVLMLNDNGDGVVLYGESLIRESQYFIGEFFEGWDIEGFSNFTGKITLEN